MCIIAHCAEKGKKAREITNPGKLHYGLSTNEFVKHGSLSESKPNLRNLRSFLQRHRFNDLFEIYGKENLEEYYDLRIFDSTKDHKEILSR